MVYKSKHDSDEGDLETGSRVCRDCDQRKPMTEFYHASGGRYRRRICHACTDERFKKRRAANPQRYSRMIRDQAIKLKYGLSREEFEALLIDQNYRCMVCETKLTLATTHVDHDHQTNRVRGLLCFNCNVAIGHLRDDSRLLDRAAAYIRRSRAADAEERWWAGIRAEFAEYGIEIGD